MSKSTKLISVLFSLLILSSCTNKTKKFLGFSYHGPNEYEISNNKPLDMPPHFNLEEIEKSNNSIKVNEQEEYKGLSAAEKILLEKTKR